ncbi:MAG: YmdB family metallophosphoesterase [Spirochaetaceae bacterium]|nr:YmdB family metallophosphoesterase [Spirochaetaceae bacterium]MBP5328802.1 YmdB family metallophosphoesterase [Spirochaetaceae bacterium]
METRLVYISEIIGKAGIQCVKVLLPELVEKYKCDFVFGCGDAATNGTGLGKQHAGYLHKLGLSVITGGDMSFFKKDMVDSLNTTSYVLRPMNFPKESPGRSYKICTVKNGKKLAVISVLGYTGFSRIHADNPFAAIMHIIDTVKKETPLVVIDFHAATTAEKKAFGFYLAGKVSAVIGSHGRVPTADETILSGGTAFITDAGKTGCQNSVGGTSPSVAVGEYFSGIPNWTKVEDPEPATKPALQGLFIVLDDKGKAVTIERINEPLYKE